jgi:hypothetical protein
LIEIWQEANGTEQVTGFIPVILSVNAVAFRPRITIHENGKVESLEAFAQLEAPDLFRQFVLNPCAFRDFVMDDFKQAYFSLFVYQVQPVDPRLTCCLVHATAAINENGNESTIIALEAIATQLRKNLFTVVGHAFDGDSCFNRLHDGFQDAWEGQFSSGPLDSFFGTQMQILIVVSDLLHLLKRIRHRLLFLDFRIGVNEDLRAFSILSIHMTAQITPVVLDNARITKMHDSLPLQLFPDSQL